VSKPEDKTPAQALFLRAFRENPTGPAADKWPAPGTFRRWLKKTSFRKDLAAIRDALRFQADLHVATAAAQAAKSLQSSLGSAPLSADTAADLTTQLKAITDLLRLAHLRQRFPADADPSHTSAGGTTAADDDRRATDNEYGTPTDLSPAEKTLNRSANNVLAQVAQRVESDPKRGWTSILNDPHRLRCYMSLAARSCTDYDPFLVSFPDILQRIRTQYPNRTHSQATPAIETP
jgi:hypothetical protein